MINSYRAAPGIDVLTTTFPIPGFGAVPINAFVLHGPEPVLVDTGPVIERAEFLTALRGVIDPRDLAWIWLTHTDFDHIPCSNCWRRTPGSRCSLRSSASAS